MTDIRLITENFLAELIPGIERASGIYIMTSFVMESGVKLLTPYLLQAAEREAEIKILSGDYLFITQPTGLTALINIHPKIEARLWQSKGTSFHPKAYLMDHAEGQGLLIVGSSNLSRTAYQQGFEWSLAMDAQAEPNTFQYALDQFSKSFYNESTIPLNEPTINAYDKLYKVYHQRHPFLQNMITDTEAGTLMFDNEIPDPFESNHLGKVELIVEPRPSQKAALEALTKTVEESYNKAMVVMATGLGKTYLAGFFSKSYKRVLFIAHHEEILHQAQRSFRRIMPERSYGLLNGQERNYSADVIFASIFTLGLKKHRESFESQHFDLIIVDEFHHAAAKSYQSVLNYFEPSFLLGITATPDRMDGKDVYGICDGNVAYQLHFIEAIQRGWLAPFHYYGVHDETDYSQITWIGSRYDEEELLAVQLKDETARKIYEAWLKHKQTRTIAFCSSIKQAEYLSNYFKQQGIAALSLHSKTYEMSRADAIQSLEQGSLSIIFTVDLFNEGVDIPSVDTLLFTRPTDSLTVFTQQVGRGLRLHEGKPFCTIVDLIGNYRNADLKLSLFRIPSDEMERQRRKNSVLPIVPTFCEMYLDTGVINLLEALSRKRQPRKEKLLNAYLDLKAELGYRPTYLELHLHGRHNSREYLQEFRSYMGFLYWAGELDDWEREVFLRSESWLREVEETPMNRSYKMVVLLYMLERGPERWAEPITAKEAAPFFHKYLTDKDYRRNIDFSGIMGKRMWDYDEARVASLIATMPMSKWSGSSKGLVVFEDGRFSLNMEIDSKDRSKLYEWTRDICLYRLHFHFERRAEKGI